MSETWVESTLGDQLQEKPRNGYSPKEVASWTGTLALGLACIKPTGFSPTQLKNVPSKDRRNLQALLHDGDLLITRANTRDLVGLVGRYRDIGSPCIYPDLMMRLVPARSVTPDFLEILLRSTAVRRQIQAISQGTSESMTKISGASIAKVHLLIPPVNEQRRITEILDALEVRASSLALIAKKQSETLAGLVSDLLANDADATPHAQLHDALIAIDAGWSPLCEEVPPPPGQWGVLKVSAVTSGIFLASESKTLLPGMRPRLELEVRPGDLILCRANGVKQLVGKAVLVRDTPSNLMLSDKLMRLVTDKLAVDNFYLELALSSDAVRRQIDAATSGSSGQNNISQSFVRALRISLPPLSRQGRVVEVSESGRTLIAALRHERAKLHVLKQGLMENLLTGRTRVSEAEAVLESL